MKQQPLAVGPIVEAAAKRMYARVLSQWAMDLMMLRRDGLDEPSARGGEGLGVVSPVAWEGAFVGQGESMRWVAGSMERELCWKPARGSQRKAA